MDDHLPDSRCAELKRRINRCSMFFFLLVLVKVAFGVLFNDIWFADAGLVLISVFFIWRKTSRIAAFLLVLFSITGIFIVVYGDLAAHSSMVGVIIATITALFAFACFDATIKIHRNRL